jgi:hypothetical protein
MTPMPDRVYTGNGLLMLLIAPLASCSQPTSAATMPTHRGKFTDADAVTQLRCSATITAAGPFCSNWFVLSRTYVHCVRCTCTA